MICSSCSLAGSWNRLGRYKLAESLHAQCEYEGGGCFCQHFVGGHHYQ